MPSSRTCSMTLFLSRVTSEPAELGSLISESIHVSQLCIIGEQEHWLHNDKVNMLNNLHPDFVGFGLSSMNSRLSTEIYRGRPFGGVGFLWRKAVSNNVQITSRSVSGRSLCISLECSNHHIINVVNVYFHCYTSSV